MANKQTPFSQWFAPALERRGIELAELGRIVGSDYNYMWRLYSGARQRPGFALTLAIGKELGDVEGAIKAAGHKMPSEASHLRSVRARISTGQIFTIVLGDDELELEADPELMRVLARYARGKAQAEQAA